MLQDNLTYAEEVLDEQPYNAEYGRATQGTAQALMAKTYAQIGDYDNCLLYCNKVIAGPYELVSDFAHIWGVSNKNNTESIFEIQQGGTSGWWGFAIFAYASSDSWPKRNIISADLVRAFEDAGDIGSRYTTTIDWQLTPAPFTMPADAWDSSEPIPFQGKYEAAGWFSQENIVIMRLADIILLAAEAQTQLDHPELAIPLLNQIRNRAGLGNTTATSKSEVALAILNERRLELVFECARWNDLKRADANGVINIVNVINSQTDSKGRSLGYSMAADKHQRIYPIPEQDRLLNKNLTQNPGYK